MFLNCIDIGKQPKRCFSGSTSKEGEGLDRNNRGVFDVDIVKGCTDKKTEDKV